MGIKYTLPHLWKQDEPDCWQPIKYDPAFGFEQERVPKVMPATKQEMDSANLIDHLRDHCAMLRIDYRQCMTRNKPLYLRCEPHKQKVFECLQDELLHDMKEFERERRLNARERRLAEKASLAG